MAWQSHAPPPIIHKLFNHNLTRVLHKLMGGNSSLKFQFTIVIPFVPKPRIWEDCGDRGATNCYLPIRRVQGAASPSVRAISTSCVLCTMEERGCASSMSGHPVIPIEIPSEIISSGTIPRHPRLGRELPPVSLTGHLNRLNCSRKQPRIEYTFSPRRKT